MAKISNTELGKLFSKQSSTGIGTSKYRTLGAAYASSPVAAKLQADRLAREEEEKRKRKEESLRISSEQVNRFLQEYESDSESFGGRLGRTLGLFPTKPQIIGETPEYKQERIKSETEKSTQLGKSTGGVLTEAAANVGKDLTFGLADALASATEGVHYVLSGKNTIDEINQQKAKDVASMYSYLEKEGISDDTRKRILENIATVSKKLESSDIYELASKSGGQIAGEVIGSVFDVVTFGVASGAIKQAIAKGGVSAMAEFLASKEGLKYLVKNSLSGAATFGGGELGAAMQDKAKLDETTERVLSSAGVGAVATPLFSLAGSAISSLFRKSVIKKTTEKATKKIESEIGRDLTSEEVKMTSDLSSAGMKEDDIIQSVVSRAKDEDTFVSKGDNVVDSATTKSASYDTLDTAGARVVTTGDAKLTSQETNIGAKTDTTENQLISEARKYKSEEEFTNDHIPVFRSGTKIESSKVTDRGISTSKDRAVSERFLRISNESLDNFDRLGIKANGGNERNVLNEYFIPKNAKIATRNDIPSDIFSKYKAANPLVYPEKAEPILGKWGKENGFDAIDYSTLGNTSSKEAEIKVLNPNILKTKSQLTDLWHKAHNGITKDTPKPKSVTAQKMNKIIGTDFEEGYNVRGINKELESAADLIEKNEKKAIQEAFTDGGDTVKQVAILAEMLGRSKGMSKELQSDIFMRIKALSTQTGQTMNIFKALTESNPHWAFMNRLIDLRLGNAMKNTKWYEFRGRMKASKRAEIFSKEKESTKKSLRKVSNESFKIKDAQDVLKSLMCDY